LGLNAFEIVTGQDFGFESSLRVFTDFGLLASEAAKLDGLHTTEADLLLAQLTFRTSGLEVRAGRQTYVDTMQYMAFDGARAKYVSPFGLGAEAYAGLWVKGGNLLGASVYQPDGTRETDSRRIALAIPTADSSLSEIEPVYGGKILIENLRKFSASAGYRKAVIAGKTDLERALVDVAYGSGLGFTALAGAEYDLYRMTLSQLRAQVRYDEAKLAITAEALRVSTVLSSNSIWYYFATAPRDEGRLRLDLMPGGPFRYYLQGVGSFYRVEVNPNTQLGNFIRSQPLGNSSNYGGNAGTSLQLARFHSSLDLTYRTGFGGTQAWADLTCGTSSRDAVYTWDIRISYANITDQLNPLLRGSFIGGQVWGSYRLTGSSRISAVLEENVNSFTRSDTKFFFVFDFRSLL
jgi:hypothetical protein